MITKTTSVIIKRQSIPFKFLREIPASISGNILLLFSRKCFIFFCLTLLLCWKYAGYWRMRIVHWRTSPSFKMLTTTSHVWRLFFTLSMWPNSSQRLHLSFYLVFLEYSTPRHIFCLPSYDSARGLISPVVFVKSHLSRTLKLQYWV